MSDVLSAVPAAPVAEWYPLSSGQLAMWLVAQTGAAHAAYTIHAVYELRGELDPEALHTAVDDLVAANESLRTAFGDVDGEPMQRVTGQRVDWRFEVTPDADDADRRITDFVGVDFDLATGAVFRSLLVRRAADHHLLVLAGHHIVLDGWSMTVLIDGVLTAYRARVQGERPPTALPLQYKDYACWQRQRLADGEFADARDHWLTTLDGELAPLELPTDRPRPAVRTFRGRLAHRTISPEDLGEFTRLCRAERATLYAGLCALVRVLLHRYTGQRDFAIGTSVLSRTVPELYDQIGYYLNSLALRDTVEPSTTFRAALRTAQATLLDGLEHHEYPIDQVVRELGAAPAAGRNALFDVMVFLDQEWGRPTADVPGLRVRHLDVGYEYSKMDLSFFFKETAGGLRLTVEYATDLFDDDRIDALLGHVATLLRSCVATPDGPVATLPLLTDAERELVVTGFNATDTDHDLETPVPQLFEQQAARTPDRLATLDERGSLTFAELNARANAVAWRLREDHGVGPGSLVALLLARSTDLMVAVLGVLKAGGGYLPVNVTDPADRVAAILADSAAVAVLVAGGEFAPPSGTPVVDIAGVAPGRADNPPPLAGPEDVGYCIYTSGSTGRPKGVLIEHRGIVNRLRWMADDLALGADDVFLQKTPYVFDVSVWELLLPGVLGATQVMLRPGAESEPAAIRDTVRRHGVTAIHFVPSMLA
ncbi:MAG TPA: condensation domain-containing protein, partial [Pseudonocardiaceae bacterium]